MNSKFSFLHGSMPYIVAIGIFIVLSFAYFFPVLEGKQLPQGDNTHAKGAAQELVEYEEQTGEVSNWTNSMFGGMPAYQIKSDASRNIFHTFDILPKMLGLPYSTVAIMFLYLLGFYILLRSMGMNNLLAIGGSIAFAFGSYNIIIIIAGHITKAYAIALMAPVVAGVLMTFKGGRQMWYGALMTTIALGMELAYNHVQITYYLALTVGFIVVAKLIYAIIDKKIVEWSKSLGLLAAAALLAFLPCVTNLWTTYEYGKYSIRGASELKAPEGEKVHSGLDKEYALAWSYGIHETPTLLIPNVVGGASEAIGNDVKTVNQLDGQIKEIVQQQSKYWGGRSFTSGPVYVGAVICFLFFIGAFFYKGRERWWLIAATIFSIMLAWGKNFLPLTDLMFYHFPLYNKFRTVEMALVIASVTMPLLGMLGVKQLYDAPELIRQSMGKFFAAIGLTGGIAALFYIAPTMFYSFLSDQEVEMFTSLKSGEMGQAYTQLEAALVSARVELLRADAMRSAILILLASASLWFYSTGKLATKYAMITISVLILIDLWGVDKRYLNNDNFVAKSKIDKEFTTSTADKYILSDKNPHRVMSLYVNPFNEVFTSYHHQSVGGYHGAKLRRYQDVIDSYLAPEYQQLTNALRSQSMENINITMANSNALNMLNTRYFIYNPNEQPIVNPYAMGACWFVDSVITAGSADEAIELIGRTNLSTTAIVENAELQSSSDSLSQIELTDYKPNALTYKTNSASDRLAVFSEIYYPAGWHAYIDNQEAEIFRANYILRAMQIPAGQHTIEFKFEPKSFINGQIVATIGSVIVLILIALAIFFSYKKRCSENIVK